MGSKVAETPRQGKERTEKDGILDFLERVSREGNTSGSGGNSRKVPERGKMER